MKLNLNIHDAIELIQYKKLNANINKKGIYISTLLKGKLIRLDLNTILEPTLKSLNDNLCSHEKNEKVLELFIEGEKIYEYSVSFSIFASHQLLKLDIQNLEVEKINAIYEKKYLNNQILNTVKKHNKVKI